MSRRTAMRLAAVSALALTTGGTVLAADRPTASAPATARAASAIGRWDLMVTMTAERTDSHGVKKKDTWTHPAWLAIENRQGKTVGRFLGGAGSVGDIGEVTVQGNKVEFKANDLKWTGAVEGDKISGTCEKSDEKGTWSGTRSVHRANVDGLWTIKPMGVPVERPATVEFVEKDGEVTGTYKEGDKKYEVTNAKLRPEAGIVIFAVEGPAGRMSFMASIKGDLLDGIMDVAGTRQRRSFKAYRQRQWAEPVELFNGKDLSNWKQFGNDKEKNWKVVDGIMATTGGDNIVSNEKFRDFRLHVEFMVPKGGNSGVYLRGRYEIQVADSLGSNPPTWHDCGALYSRIAPAVNACMKPDTWQTYDITLVGSYVTVIFNGQLIIDNEEVEGITGGMLDCNEDKPGPIYLQGDHGKISYRKVTIWSSK
jgi:hypothetical protein